MSQLQRIHFNELKRSRVCYIYLFISSDELISSEEEKRTARREWMVIGNASHSHRHNCQEVRFNEKKKKKKMENNLACK